jgi:hypothetical protein
MECDFLGGQTMDTTESTPQQSLPAKTSGKAVASLVLGICSFCTLGITGIIGLILGIVALGNIKRNPAGIKGGGLAIAGIVVSCVSFMFVLIQLAILLLPVLERAPFAEKQIASLNNLKNLSLALILYTDDYEGKFPPSENWPEVLKPYYQNDKILISPFNPEAGRGYAMNANLDGRKRPEIQQKEQVVLFFECKPGSPPGGGPELLPEPPRAGRGYCFAFLDGHADWVRQERLDELIWEPLLRP